MKDNILKRYWRAYGGIRSLLSSPYLYIATLLTIALFPHWSAPDWWDDVLSIMPNLLGFSLGGYAMLIAFGDEKFMKIISGDDDGSVSPYMELSATFTHFIILQILSIILALFAKTYSFSLPPAHFILELLGDSFRYLCLAGYSFAYLIFMYALTSTLAATLALLRVSSWYDFFQTDESKRSKDKSKPD